ncbi:MAG: stalk domain-containing protein [Clostridia bacterium]|nr:stalk domain-containing protein [Clostridia bacterium]
MKLLKAIFVSLSSAIMLINTSFGVYGETNNNAIKVTVDGNTISFEQPPVIIEGRTLVPLRAIFEALGAEVEWDGETKQIMAFKDDVAVLMTVNSNVMTSGTVGGTAKDTNLDVAPTIINGSTMIPARAIAESFDCSVTWDSSTKTVKILSSDNKISKSADNKIGSITASVIEQVTEQITEPVTENVSLPINTDEITQTAIKGYATIRRESYSNIFDGKPSTKWCVTGFKNAYVIWETSAPVSVIGYTIITGNDNSKYHGRNPSSWTLYGCNSDDIPERDSADWNVIDSRKNDRSLPDADYADCDYKLLNPTPKYKYYKLEITATRGADVMQMSEFELIFNGSNHTFKTTPSSNSNTSTDNSTSMNQTPVTCSSCGGSGRVTCAFCHGTGKGQTINIMGMPTQQGCTYCGSAGWRVCDSCGGYGEK